MTKTLIITGSLRQGNSNALAQLIKDELTGIDCEEINLGKLKMQFCDGCLGCDESEKCVKEDELSLLYGKLEAADKLVLITPARWSLLSGEMKVFLDRLNPFAVSEKLKGKKAYCFAIGQSQEGDSESIEKALESLKFFCDNAEIDYAGGSIVCDCLMPQDILQNTKLQDYVAKAVSFIRE